MYIIIEYNMEEEEDRIKYMRMTRASNMESVLFDFATWLRSVTKYAAEPVSVEEAKKEFHELCELYGVNPWGESNAVCF